MITSLKTYIFLDNNLFKDIYLQCLLNELIFFNMVIILDLVKHHIKIYFI